jgi:hypothetical protein
LVDSKCFIAQCNVQGNIDLSNSIDYPKNIDVFYDDSKTVVRSIFIN